MTAKMIVANWKSHKTLEEAKHWLQEVGPATKGLPRSLDGSAKNSAAPGSSIVLCPPFPFLVPLQEIIEKQHYSIALGVQDISPFPAGSYTGAVSVRNLEGMRVTHAILGHTEQRKYFHETNQRVANKVALALEEGITPIVCVEESNVIAQAETLDQKHRPQCVVAFEPAGSIGNGEPDDVNHVIQVAVKIRKAFSQQTKVLYGGSVDVPSIGDFLAAKELDGVLVGTASLDAKNFIALLGE